MSTLLILAGGLIVVVGGILILRLHAFVALILAALLVAVLTPADAIIRSQVMARAVRITVADRMVSAIQSTAPMNTDVRWVLLPEHANSAAMTATPPLPLVDWPGAPPGEFGYRLQPPEDQPAIVLPEGITRLRAVPQSDYAAAAKAAASSAILRVTESLGSACGKLAILIVAASIIGQCMLRSGAADRVVQATLLWFGERAAPLAFMVSAFTLAIPVFFDTVFLLMVPLARSLFQRTRRNYLLYILAIVAGGTMAHSLVPPTPGPLLIAEAFQIPMGRMILGGCVVGLTGASGALLFAMWRNRRDPLVPSDADLALPALPETSSSVDVSALPSLPEALLPVLLPVALMTLETQLDPDTLQWNLGPLQITGTAARMLQAACERNMALLIGAGLSLLTLIRFRRPSRQDISAEMQSAITSAGTIILVTAAGGAFGTIMQQTSVAELLQQIPAASPLAIVLASFAVTTAVRTAQGSATVAMMTAAGVFGGLVTSGAAGVDPLYVALAVGCGSKPFPWMNDSGFLVITRMSGMSEAQGLRNVTTMVAIAGFAGLAAVVVGVVFFP